MIEICFIAPLELPLSNTKDSEGFVGLNVYEACSRDAVSRLERQKQKSTLQYNRRHAIILDFVAYYRNSCTLLLVY